MARGSSREAILDAAEAVVLENGGGHITLDAVAKKAGVSKGGLFYNFPTKEALLEAMIVRYAERLREDRSRPRAAMPDEPTRDIRAYVLSALDRDSTEKRMGVALLAAVAHDLQMLEPAKLVYRRMLDDIVASSPRPERAIVISLATDGLWLMELLGVCPLDDKQREQVMAELLRMTEE